MNKKSVVIYHRADFDGIFCREIARKFLGDTAEYIGWDYGDAVPVIGEDVEVIYMLDISIPELMDRSELCWVDHHKSAIEQFDPSILGYRIDGVAACRLAWQLFINFANSDDDCPTKEMYVQREVREPLAVRLAGEYDIWDKRDPRAELFQHGLRSQNLDLMWPLLLQMPEKMPITEMERLIDAGHPPTLQADGTVDPSLPWVEQLLRQGEAIQYAATRQNASIIEAYGFTVKFEGLTFLACNHARFNSHLFTAGIKPEHDALLGFNYDGKNGVWRVSLYHAPGKEEHDLSQIAKKHGGGGHRGACGFRVAAWGLHDGRLFVFPAGTPQKLDANGKHPYLFYWEDSQGAWTPVPDLVENMISTDNLGDGETMEIEFKRTDMTPAEFAALPEI